MTVAIYCICCRSCPGWWPGQAPTSFRRLFFAALAHGTKIIDLYEMHSTAFTTENSIGEYPAENGTYELVQDTLYEYGQFDDLIQSVSSQSSPPADVAVYFSTAADAWMGDRDGPCTYLPKAGTSCSIFKAAKRALVIALRQQQLTVDVVNEEDAVSRNTLAQYQTLYVVDPHVSSRATAAISAWVAQGGTLYVTASGGLYDEKNAQNAPMRELLGLSAFTTTKA
eukprot:COSAG01_NODE_22964_length_834_cov_0.912925_1_plen_224_part_01